MTLLVGVLPDGGQYNATDGVSTATPVELYRLCPWACHLDLYLARVAPVPEPSAFALAVLAPHNVVGFGLPILVLTPAELNHPSPIFTEVCLLRGSVPTL